MNDLRKAAQQALEALEIASRNGATGLMRYEIKEIDDTIANLRAALAQPDPAEVRQGWEYMREKGLLQETWNEHPIDTDTTRGPMLMTVGDTLARAGFIKKPKPLTEEEIAQIDWKDGETLHDFARAIEKAHGIGGEE